MLLNRLLCASRYLTIIAIVFTLIASTGLLIYGAGVIWQLLVDTMTYGELTAKGLKKFALISIEVVDIFLLSTVLYIVAAGLYELFIGEVDLPGWLTITNLDMLKDKLIAVVIVMLGVLFLGQVISWDGQRDLLGFGIATALVIATLTFFLSQKPKKDEDKH